jgi:hypothetical protein
MYPEMPAGIYYTNHHWGSSVKDWDSGNAGIKG